MARPRTLPDNHFRFSTFRKGDSTYVYGYRNEWDPVKKQSRIAKRIYVGTLNEATGRLRLGKKYLSNHPEYEGKTLYFENRTLVERSEQDAAEEVQQREQSWASNNLSYAATWALWQFASKNRILQNLQAAFGKQLGTGLLALAVYQLLDGGAMNGYEDWLPDNWLPVSAPLSSQRISELLAQVDHEDMVNYFRLRFDRSKQNYQKWLEEIKQKAQKQSSAMPPSTLQKMYMALDSTAISTFSMTIEDAAYGHAKQNPELKQINLTLAVDFLNGDVCYAREDEGSITDKSVYKSILAQMKSYGFDLDETVLVTDRGYSSLMNLQNLFNTDVSFVAGVPIVEKGLKDKFTKFREALCDLAFYNSEYEVYCRTIKEDWKQNTEAGSVNRDCFVHLYRFPEIALSQQKQLLKKIDKVLDKKRDGKVVDRDDWNFAARFITECKEEQDGKERKNGTMFGPLMDFQDNDYLKEHSIVTFDTMYRPGTYKIFASFQSKAYDPDSEEFKYYDFINAETAYDFEEYLNNIKNLSLYYDEENAPSFGDEIITLSTCDYYTTDGRFAVLAKRIK